MGDIIELKNFINNKKVLTPKEEILKDIKTYEETLKEIEKIVISIYTSELFMKCESIFLAAFLSSFLISIITNTALFLFTLGPLILMLIYCYFRINKIKKLNSVLKLEEMVDSYSVLKKLKNYKKFKEDVDKVKSQRDYIENFKMDLGLWT